MEKIEIPLNKSKLLFGIGGAILFVTTGIYLLNLAEEQTKFNPIVVTIVGWLAILFFGIVGIYGMIKLFDKKIGVAIDEDGILDNSNAGSVGLIKWTDITQIKTEQIKSTAFLLIFVTNPQEYINRNKGLKKKLQQANMKMYDTPIAITSNTLQCSFKDLERQVREKFAELNATQLHL
ncbi:STM3941 family protein [Flavobacterium rhizosphaerae]|uniref:STM3941 family protein n=1 Tax=Flavobacterium rhizosphaerae TaxID=3163298 RepID=A0ABW8Z0R9_9FLAO